jgi:hypothetical protein
MPSAAHSWPWGRGGGETTACRHNRKQVVEITCSSASACKARHCEVADALCCSQQTVGARGRTAACRTKINHSTSDAAVCQHC